MDFDRNAAFRSPEQDPGAGYPPHAGPQAYQPVPATPVGTAFWRCVGASSIWVAVVLVVQFAVVRAPVSGEAVGYLLGSMLLPLFGTAWLTWLFFRRKRPAFWALVLGSLPAFLLSFVVFGAMRLAGRS